MNAQRTDAECCVVSTVIPCAYPQYIMKEITLECGSKYLTSLIAAQNLLCRTLCRACSLGGGSSPLRCSRSSSSITLHTSITHKTQTRLGYQQGKSGNCPLRAHILRGFLRPQVRCVANMLAILSGIWLIANNNYMTIWAKRKPCITMSMQFTPASGLHQQWRMLKSSLVLMYF